MLAKIEMTRNKKKKKNRLFGRHFETVQHLIFLFYFIYLFIILIADFWVFIVSTYMVQITLHYSGGKVFFLGRFHWTPLATNGSKSTLVA